MCRRFRISSASSARAKQEWSVKILISAAETSSDLHGAALLEALRRQEPDLEAFGIGGSKLQAQGLRTIVDARGLLSMGFIEILARLPQIFGALRDITAAAAREKPDVAVVIDYPDFHFRLARKLKRLGIPVVYYIPPKVWAWRKGRVRILRELFARLLCILPFEEEFYRREKVAVTYVGNPLLDELPLALSRSEARTLLSIDANRRALLLMPGSRPGELKYHLERLLDAAFFAANGMQEQGKLGAGERLLVLLPCAHTTDPRTLDARIHAWREGAEEVWATSPAPGKFPLELRLSQGDAHFCMVAADVGIIKSGTSTLEAGLLGCVHSVVYRSHWFSQLIFYFLIRYKGPVGLVNLVAGWEKGKSYLVKEILGRAMTPAAVAAEILSLFDNSQRRAGMERGFSALREKMLGDGRARPSERAASEVLSVARQSLKSEQGS